MIQRRTYDPTNSTIPHPIRRMVSPEFHRAGVARSQILMNFPQSMGIPNSREPEFGVLIGSFTDYTAIFNRLGEHPNVVMNTDHRMRGDILISFAEDTIEDESLGSAAFQVQKLGLEKRTRAALISEGFPATTNLYHTTSTFKTVEKTVNRKEWQAQTDEELLKLIEADVPEVAHINPAALRIMGLCVASRCSYDFTHVLPDQSACVVYEVCNDACAMTGPDPAKILSYRMETEPEAHAILLPTGRNVLSDQEAGQILDASLDEIKSHLMSGTYAAPVRISTLSKIAATIEAARNSVQPGLEGDGLLTLMKQGRTVGDYGEPGMIAKISSIFTSNILPRPSSLMPGAHPAELEHYFQHETERYETQHRFER